MVACIGLALGNGRSAKARFRGCLERGDRECFEKCGRLWSELRSRQHRPAVGTPEPGSLDPCELLNAFHHFENAPPLAFELTEYNSLLDSEDKSFHLIQ